MFPAVWTEVGSRTYHKWTVPEFVRNQTETTSSTMCVGLHFRAIAIAVFTAAQMNHIKEVNTPWFDLTKLNKAGMSMLMNSKW